MKEMSLSLAIAIISRKIRGTDKQRKAALAKLYAEERRDAAARAAMYDYQKEMEGKNGE